MRVCPRQREIQVRKTGIQRKVVRGSDGGLCEVNRVLDEAKGSMTEQKVDLGGMDQGGMADCT